MGKLITAAIAVTVLLVAGFVLFWHVEYGTERTVTFKIVSRDDQPTSNNGHQYLVWTGQNHVLKDTDSILHGKTDSSNVWGKLQIGRILQCPIYGYRLFWTSSYPDILDGCKVMPAGTATNY